MGTKNSSGDRKLKLGFVVVISTGCLEITAEATLVEVLGILVLNQKPRIPILCTMPNKSSKKHTFGNIALALLMPKMLVVDFQSCHINLKSKYINAEMCLESRMTKIFKIYFQLQSALRQTNAYFKITCIRRLAVCTFKNFHRQSRRKVFWY